MLGLISVNGKVTAPEAAMVPALDRGFLMADDIFEVLVAFGGKLLDLDRHLVRLRQSAEKTQIPVPWSDAELGFELQALADQVRAPKMYLRLTVTRGLGMGVKPPKDPKPTKVIYCFPAADEPLSSYKEGLGLKRTLKVGAAKDAAAKTGNYLQGALALAQAEREGFQDILWTNAESEVLEAATANVFFMAREGDNVEFVTPPAASGILLGVTRDTVITLLSQAKIPVREQQIFADELPRFDEAFLTSTVRGLVPVSRIDRHHMHSARPAATFRHIERLFLTWVETQVGHRVDFRTGKPLNSTR
jgi:branched-subunit amino acid aminotransferase/4-amino-4-deoxychorismate lyase